MQKLFNIPQPSLHGVYRMPALPVFTLNSWFELSWQDQYSSWYESNVGFRSWLIKIRNQLEWALDKKVVSAVVVGKQEYLYEKAYIDAYTGNDFIGFDSAHKLYGGFINLSQSLEKKGIPVLHVLAPSKAAFYPQYIPDEYQPWVRGISNYDVLTHFFQRAHLNTIDFTTWFQSIKDTSQHLLYSKSGIHWTIYGASLAGDSLIKSIAKMTHTGTVQNRLLKVDYSEEPIYPDGDLSKLLNILSTKEDVVYSYPYWSSTYSSDYKSPRILFIGDSYFWTLCKSAFFSKAFSPESEYWYYAHDRYSNQDGFSQLIQVITQSDKKRMWDDFDAVVFIHTAPSFPKYGFGLLSDKN